MHARAIETRFRGYRFRSRLAARWGVFFDALGLRWEYEPEGFELPSGRYLPDFRVEYPGRDPSERHYEWFECKGDLRTVTHAEWAKMLEFQALKGLTILDGVPDSRMYLTPSEICSPAYAEADAKPPTPYAAQLHAFQHERFGYSLWSYKARMWWDEHSNFFEVRHPLDDWGQRAIADACNAARSARFEHGESGPRGGRRA